MTKDQRKARGGARHPRKDIARHSRMLARVVAKRATAWRLFSDPWWPIDRLIAWVAFRNPLRMEYSPRAAAFYDATKAALTDSRPAATVLHALQDGTLVAIRDGKKIGPEAWSAVDVHGLPGVRAFIRRVDALALWLPLESRPLTVGAGSSQARKHSSASRSFTRASVAKVQAKLREYLEAEKTAGRSASQKRAWAWVKNELPTASYRQVIDQLAKRPRGRPRSKKSE